MATSDAWLRKGGSHKIYNVLGEEWLADRAAVRALVEALPMNMISCDASNCGAVATRTDNDRDIYACDKHAADFANGDFEDMRHAAAFRALLERMRGWDGET